MAQQGVTSPSRQRELASNDRNKTRKNVSDLTDPKQQHVPSESFHDLISNGLLLEKHKVLPFLRFYTTYIA